MVWWVSTGSATGQRAGFLPTFPEITRRQRPLSEYAAVLEDVNNVGPATSKVIAREYETLEGLRASDRERLEGVYGVGLLILVRLLSRRRGPVQFWSISRLTYSCFTKSRLEQTIGEAIVALRRAQSPPRQQDHCQGGPARSRCPRDLSIGRPTGRSDSHPASHHEANALRGCR